jgi:hypothetical protein
MGDRIHFQNLNDGILNEMKKIDELELFTLFLIVIHSIRGT